MWVFLGLSLPRLGTEQGTLLRDGFLVMDQSTGAVAGDRHLMKRQEDKAPWGVARVGAVTHERTVRVVTVVAQVSQDAMVDAVQRDRRCARVGNIFECALGGPNAKAFVEVCNSIIVLYDESDRASREYRERFCGRLPSSISPVKTLEPQNKSVLPAVHVDRKKLSGHSWFGRHGTCLGMIAFVLSTGTYLAWRKLRA